MKVSIKHYDREYRIGATEFKTAVPHKWLHGDTVNPDTDDIVKRTTHRRLVGIVDFVNRTGMGFTARNIPLYLWYPLDTRYPPMCVAAKDRPTTNQFAVVNLEHWDEKRPRGGIVERLGDVGNIEV